MPGLNMQTPTGGRRNQCAGVGYFLELTKQRHSGRGEVSRVSIRRWNKRPSIADKEKGAVAVELALVLPVFILLVLGIFEFGRAFNIQVSLSEAARESARYAAIHSTKATYSVAAAQGAGVAAAPSVALTQADVVITYSTGTSCAADVNVISTVKYSTGFITGMEKLIGVAQPFTLKGVGVMRCGG